MLALADRRNRDWRLILHRPNVDLCLRDEGFEVDLYVSTGARMLADTMLGRRDLRETIGAGLIDVDGPRDLVRAFPRWIMPSPYAQPTEPSLAGARHG